MEEIDRTNFDAYKDKGRLSSFRDEKSIKQYRKQNLDRQTPCVEFVKKIIPIKKLRG